jgi:hypothetical protein
MLLALSLLVLASGTGAQAVAQPATSLRISFWEDDRTTGAPDSVWTLRCNPARGTLARPGRACGRLLAGSVALFKAFPPDTACTAIYGGPQRARIVGTLAGKRVWAVITRTNGCEISRWDRLSPWLLPVGGVTS